VIIRLTPTPALSRGTTSTQNGIPRNIKNSEITETNQFALLWAVTKYDLKSLKVFL